MGELLNVEMVAWRFQVMPFRAGLTKNIKSMERKSMGFVNFSMYKGWKEFASGLSFTNHQFSRLAVFFIISKSCPPLFFFFISNP